MLKPLRLRRTLLCKNFKAVHSNRRPLRTWSNLPGPPKFLAFALIGAGAVGVASGIYNYTRIPPSPYPEEVNKFLRKALYYEGAGNDPKEAISCYLQALEVATELGLDQTSDDMSGLKIKIGAVYEDAGRFSSAIRIYSGLLNELQSSMRSGNIGVEEHTRLLRRALGTSVKVGDLAHRDPAYHDLAESSYVWALESMLKETTRRKGDTSWLEDETTGGLYEAVATYYYETDRAHLALPLFLKALEFLKKQNCHTITLMNNIASSIASQSDSQQVQSDALQWAERARDLKITPSSVEDQSECDSARCLSIFNIGRIEELQLRFDAARSHYEEAKRKAIKLKTGDRAEIINMSSEALMRIADRQA